MPEVRRFRVTETREVEVVANDFRAALVIAAHAFENIEYHGEEWGSATSEVRVVSVHTDRLLP